MAQRRNRVDELCAAANDRQFLHGRLGAGAAQELQTQTRRLVVEPHRNGIRGTSDPHGGRHVESER